MRTGTGRAGLPTIGIATEFGTATVYLQGAQVTSWIPAGGDEVLFVSDAARHVPGTAIRGGIPVCFPQFAELGPLPMHGFAYAVPWQQTGSTGASVTLALRDSAETLAVWPHRFVAELGVSVERDALRVTFAVTNTGDAPLQWSGTLHTYLALDARRARLRGLGPARFVDRAHQSRLAEDPEREMTVPGHTDRAYLDAGPEVIVDDGIRRLLVQRAGFRDTVVWNPGPETVGSFPDLRGDDHRRFVCVEAAEVRPVTVPPGVTWSGAQMLRRPLKRG